MFDRFQFLLIVATVVLAGCQSAQQPQAAPDAKKPTKTGIASFSGSEFAGKKTASGELFKPEALTAASRTLPLGSHAQVRNLETGQQAIVKMNDRGPFAEGRLIDLSRKAARNVGIAENKGLVKVSVTPVLVADNPTR